MWQLRISGNFFIALMLLPLSSLWAANDKCQKTLAALESLGLSENAKTALQSAGFKTPNQSRKFSLILMERPNGEAKQSVLLVGETHIQRGENSRLLEPLLNEFDAIGVEMENRGGFYKAWANWPLLPLAQSGWVLGALPSPGSAISTAVKYGRRNGIPIEYLEKDVHFTLRDQLN